MDSRAGASGAGKGFWRIPALLILLLAALAVYRQQPRPGRTTLTYRIGQVDPRFGLSREEVAEAVRSAVAIWRGPAARELFREDPRGDIEINLIYDQRQETLDRLKILDRRLAAGRGSIEALQATYAGQKAGFDQQQDTLKADYAAHNRQVLAFNAEQENLRRHGDATENELRRMASERNALAAALVVLQRREQDLEAARTVLNATVADVNRGVAGQRAEVATYHQTGSLLKEAFDEGEYVRHNGRKTINIYCYADARILVRVLAHELGHALGIRHGQDPNAIMFRLMQSESLEPAPEDLAALKAAGAIQWPW